MKKTMKKCLAMLLALAMLFAMAIPAAADETEDYKRTITFTEVAEGDTVKAYQLMKYAEDYNSYIFDEGFEKVFSQWKPDSMTFDDYFAKNVPGESLSTLIGYYVDHALRGTFADSHNLPAVFAQDKANAAGEVKLTLDPGYYLFLVTTTVDNSKVYKPVTAFVQVKNEQVKVYAGDNTADITNSLTLTFKHAKGPEIAMRVLDDSLSSGSAWRAAAAGDVGEAMGFYIHVTMPAYQGVVDMPTLQLETVLSNLEYVDGTAKVFSSIDAIAGTAAVADAVDATAGTYADGEQTMTMKLNYNKIKNTDGSVSVYVYFKATVKPEAAVKDTDGIGSATLKYATSLEPENVKTTEEDSTTVYSYAFSLTKLSDTLKNEENKDEGYTALTGAEFTVYAKDATDTAISMVRVENGDEVYYRPATAEEIAAATGVVTSLPADHGADNNTLLVRGLDIGSYTVKESKTPSGYYAPKGNFKVEFIGERTNVENELTGVLLGTSRFVELTESDKLLPNGSSINADETGRLDASLKNSSSPLLPTTGGVGTVMFTVVGVVLMALALWFFLFRRRRDEE